MQRRGLLKALGGRLAGRLRSLSQSGPLWFAVQVIRGVSRDGVLQMSAALAYYAALSLAPLFIVILGVVGLLADRAEALQYVVAEVEQVIGRSSAELIQQIAHRDGVAGGGAWATLIGLGTLCLGATAVFGQLQAGLNAIWRVGPKPGISVRVILRRRLLSLAMVLGIGFLLLVSLIGHALLSAAMARLSTFSGVPLETGALAHIGVSLAATTLLTTMLFRWLPDARTAWRDIWRGALFTGVLFQAGEWLIGQYLGRAAVGSAYGAAGSLVVLLVWVYYSSLIVFVGAEFTRVYATRLGAGTKPEDFARREPAPGAAAAHPAHPLARS